ncbi:ribosome biogenesis factor YjgA [Pigmentiphaga litoralis]|uniref:Dual-action ribosomal maturation protein DarP n=1 Tax=Pigmentiphaga litoralis TaxID=516702 RepID=A0A7Y9IYI6_9BURK|nr:ribosome biogenesis factor YjgA [Pigmentiphaga litoralis]NYE26045.1 ribosome-associated protein [Pigmentiphaga litoralis]NYE85165.1 ribosome-associated protein [Pigmentiphaga litoralis]
MSRKSFVPIDTNPPVRIDEDGNPDLRPPSKSQLKRDSTRLQELGVRLTKLSPARLKQLPLAELLYQAIREAQKITSHEAKRRQMQLVGKLMRDAQIDPIQAQLAKWEGDSQDEIAAFHQLELWRDKLLADDEHFTKFMNLYPAADAQQMRALIRAARKEQAANKALLQGHEPQRKHFRVLFQEIKRLQADAQGDTDRDTESDIDDDEDD